MSIPAVIKIQDRILEALQIAEDARDFPAIRDQQINVLISQLEQAANLCQTLLGEMQLRADEIEQRIAELQPIVEVSAEAARIRHEGYMSYNGSNTTRR